MSDICFVIQPFSDPYDRRYDEVFEPAIRAAGLEPYRVDRDPTTTVLIDDIERRIRGATVCLADITDDNPNVWYELGFAMAASVEVCLVASDVRSGKFPFDIQHRHVTTYKTDSPGDFNRLRDTITERLKAAIHRNKSLQKVFADDVAEAPRSPDMSDLELACLIVVGSEGGADSGTASEWTVQRGMETAGYNKLGANMALRKLMRRSLIVAGLNTDDEEPYSFYYMTDEGWQALEKGLDSNSLLVKTKPVTGIGKYNSDDDLPF